jgi:hypothetical protein
MEKQTVTVLVSSLDMGWILDTNHSKFQKRSDHLKNERAEVN